MTAETTQGGGQSPEPGSDEWYDQLGELVANSPTPRHRPNRTKAAPLPPAPDPAPGVMGSAKIAERASELFADKFYTAFEWPDLDDDKFFEDVGLLVFDACNSALEDAARSHNAALSEAVGALERIAHGECGKCDRTAFGGVVPFDCDLPGCYWTRSDAVEVAAATLSRLKSSTGGGE